MDKIIELGKNESEKGDMNNVIHQLESKSCDKSYVGQPKDFYASEEVNVKVAPSIICDH